MLLYPNAKINLGLNVVGRRADGYHDIETVFYPIPLCDALELVRIDAPDCCLEQSGMVPDALPEQNLVVKAYRLLQRDYGLGGVSFRLRKNIPFGAGLGGGSSDAAYALCGLNRLFGLGLSAEKLKKYAAMLGADCAFFVENKPVYAEGIGNVFSSISLNLAGWYLVLVKPDVHISTADAYADVAVGRPDVPLAAAIRELPPEKWRNYVINDFEQSVFARFPEVADIKESLYKKGAVYASMSGSGSSVFGLFRHQPADTAFGSCFVYACVLPDVLQDV